jgi:hypothetical protein
MDAVAFASMCYASQVSPCHVASVQYMEGGNPVLHTVVCPSPSAVGPNNSIARSWYDQSELQHGVANDRYSPVRQLALLLENVDLWLCYSYSHENSVGNKEMVRQT